MRCSSSNSSPGPPVPSASSLLMHLPYLFEAFMDFSACRALSLTSRALNHDFSTNGRRLLSRYRSRNEPALLLSSSLYVGVFDVLVPLSHVQLFPARGFTRLFARTAPTVFTYLFDSAVLSCTADLDRCIVRHDVDAWRLVRNDSERLVLEYPRGVDLQWQSLSFLKTLQRVDVCMHVGVWCTCEVVAVTEGEVIVKVPWWARGGGMKCVRYPSVYLAQAGTHAYDWRVHVKVHSRLKLRWRSTSQIVDVVLCNVDAGDVYTYVAQNGSHVFLLRSLEDDNDVQLGPVWDCYLMSSAAFSISSLDLSDSSTRTRVTFYARTRYDLPSVTLVGN